MFNIGTGELLVIIIVGLIVFGPNKMPEMMRNLGKALRAFQAELTKATTSLREGLEESQAAQPTPVPPPEVSPEIRRHEDT